MDLSRLMDAQLSTSIETGSQESSFIHSLGLITCDQAPIMRNSLLPPSD
jgi:hypothetical protein